MTRVLLEEHFDGCTSKCAFLYLLSIVTRVFHLPASSLLLSGLAGETDPTPSQCLSILAQLAREFPFSLAELVYTHWLLPGLFVLILLSFSHTHTHACALNSPNMQ